MNKFEKIDKEIDEHLAVVDSIRTDGREAIAKISEVIAKALTDGKKLLLCGNGGSAADAQHIAAEFVVRFRANRRALAAIALTTDTSALTACGNDFGFESIFSRQVEALGDEGDVLIGISTSGTSPNVVAALEEAKRRKMVTILFRGEKTVEVDCKADVILASPSAITARIQECHLLAGHIICGLVEDELFSN